MAKYFNPRRSLACVECVVPKELILHWDELMLLLEKWIWTVIATIPEQEEEHRKNTIDLYDLIVNFQFRMHLPLILIYNEYASI